MNKLKQIEERILEIKAEKARQKKEIESRPIVMALIDGHKRRVDEIYKDELDELNIKRQFTHDERVMHANIVALVASLAVSFLGMAVSLAVAFMVPPWEQRLKQQHDEQAAIQSLYQTVVANGDIFSSNYNAVKQALATSTPMAAPESHIEFPISDDVHKLLQRGLGIDQYRFLLYYFGQTSLLNEEIRQVRDELITRGPTQASQLVSATRYWTTLDSLEKGGWKESKFNYVYDPECLESLMSRAFAFIDEAKRDKRATCNTDSLNRIFYHYGYIPDEVPAWLVPDLRDALNIREPGLGDSLILDPQN